uniref:Reverse transcriptase domain-containing protein n=1 Tax=Oryzias sinensis TaxID=183150 RepID=A0A8C7XZI9_9TELE
MVRKISKCHHIVGGDFNNVPDNNADRCPPRAPDGSNTKLKKFMEKSDLHDIWRKKNPDVKCFTWRNKAGTNQSRIDFWLVSKNVAIDQIDVNICPTPLTDHKAIVIKIKFTTSKSYATHSAYWKRNSSILLDDNVKKQIKREIAHFWSKANIDKKYGLHWELFKFEINKYLRKVSSDKAKSRRAHEANVISGITHLCQNNADTLSDEDKLQLSNLQTELDHLYLQKAKGAFVRSPSRWLENGEQNSHYFFNLERHHSKGSSIHRINIDGTISEDHKVISNYCCEFYQKLYSSKFSQGSTDAFIDSLTVKTITESEKEQCESMITLEEVQKAIEQLKSNKSPGTDGLTSEFYKCFAEDLSPFLHQMFLESIDKELLPTTLTQGLTTLIPKSGKDPLFLDNWRPISLLNNDYKIFATILAKRLKLTLDSVIDETQSGFMSGRHIMNNIRLVLDILDYPDIINDNGFILFLDFYKAFDTVEHKFILHCLKKFGFGEYFYSAIVTLYRNCNSSIKLAGGTSPRFNLERGIRQGCPVSPYLFLLVPQLLTDHIKSSALEGINLIDKELIITQLADDTTLFLKNEKQIPVAFDIIGTFSKASGLCLNVNKCELMAIKECAATTLYNLPVKSEVKYLGILITKDQQARSSLNFNPIIEKTQRKLNQWLSRDLSLRGRILLSKAEGISRLTYAALALHVDDEIIKEIDKMLFNFIWKNRTHYLRKNVLMNSYDKGGLNFLDFYTLNNTFKINWLKQLFRNPSSIWNTIPLHI